MKRPRAREVAEVISRLREVYGMLVGRREYDELCVAAKARTRASAYEGPGEAQRVVQVHYAGRRVTALWDETRGRVLSVLPPSY